MTPPRMAREALTAVTLDLRATQVLRTNNNSEDPFAFTSRTARLALSAALDTPLNRRLQRNNFRIALINYNVGLRNLIAAEDNIKLDVREDLSPAPTRSKPVHHRRGQCRLGLRAGHQYPPSIAARHSKCGGPRFFGANKLIPTPY